MSKSLMSKSLVSKSLIKNQYIMKKFYHLLVTSYKLRVTSYRLRVERFKRFTSHLLPHTSYLIPLFAFLFLPFSAFAQTAQATITNVDFSCPGTVEITYDLITCDPANITLYYSSDKCNWAEAITVSGIGSTLGQTTGYGKTIVWDAAADNVTFGKFYFKVEYPIPPLPPEPTPVFINGVYWSPVNLDFGGWFCENPWDYGGLYQWGRFADGHECRTSPCWPITPDCGSSSANGVVSLSGNQVPCSAAPCGYFIRQGAAPYDWRTPQANALWNSVESNPIKTINDPCPDGWRVPTYNELNGLLSTIINGSGSLATYPSTTIAGRWFGDGGVPSLFLPAAGARSLIDGSVSGGTGGNYWCSTPYTTSAYHLYFVSGYFGMATYYRAYGLSVRCVLEQ